MSVKSKVMEWTIVGGVENRRWWLVGETAAGGMGQLWGDINCHI